MQNFQVLIKSTIIYEIKKSKFISSLIPYKDFSSEMQKLKQEHPKAVHFVYAWRHINEIGQLHENLSDDGEPKGSSGKPTLAVLAGRELVETALITVRYFGGIKLGVGGLVRAYTQSAQEVIISATIVPYSPLKELTLFVSFPHVERVLYYLAMFEGMEIQKDFKENGLYLFLKIPANEYEKFIHLVEQYCERLT